MMQENKQMNHNSYEITIRTMILDLSAAYAYLRVRKSQQLKPDAVALVEKTRKALLKNILNLLGET